MSGSDSASTKADLEALQALQADAGELERIEHLLDRFNVFEAIGFINQETIHSYFLAFLLDPRQNHDLDDLFLKGFLESIKESSNRVSLPVDLNSANDGALKETKVHTEVHTGDGRLDIQLHNHAGRWSVIIENKIWTKEHSNQLDRYYRFVKQTDPDWEVVAIYLTPYGDLPSHKAYIPFDYKGVCKVIETILEDRDSSLRPDVRMSLDHYQQMLRRNIVKDFEPAKFCNEFYFGHQKALDLIYEHSVKNAVEESELARSCDEIYFSHQKALNLIYRHRFFHQEHIRDQVLKLINTHPSLLHDYRGTLPPKEFIGFRLRKYDTVALRVAKGWGGWKKTGYILRFVVANLPESLELILQIGPGDEVVRQKLLTMVNNNPTIFRKPAKARRGREINIFVRPILSSNFYQGVSYEEREQEIQRQWDAFLEEDLPRIEAALKKEKWIWESVEPDEGQSSQGSRFVWGEGDIEITKRPEDDE